MRTDKVDQRRGQVVVKLVRRSGHGERRRQRSVLAILELLRDDVYANLIIFDVGDGPVAALLPRSSQ